EPASPGPRVPDQARGRHPRRRPGLTRTDRPGLIAQVWSQSYRRRTAGPNEPTLSTGPGPSPPRGTAVVPDPPAPAFSSGAASHPLVVSSFSTVSTASWRVITEVSRTRSASRGSSYGSDTPVKPVISPARALA